MLPSVILHYLLGNPTGRTLFISSSYLFCFSFLYFKGVFVMTSQIQVPRYYITVSIRKYVSRYYYELVRLNRILLELLGYCVCS